MASPKINEGYKSGWFVELDGVRARQHVGVAHARVRMGMA
jgi:hypothetical protein